MNERFSFFIWNFPLLIEHEHHGDKEKTRRYEIGLQRLRLLRRLAEPFAYGPLDRAKEHGEIIYAFLVPITEDIASPNIPKNIRYEYLAGSIVDRKNFKLFAYIWFKSLDEAKRYAKIKGMTIIGGWNE